MIRKKYKGKTLTEIYPQDMPSYMFEFYSNSDIYVFEDSDGNVYEFGRRQPQESELMYVYNSFDEFVECFNHE